MLVVTRCLDQTVCLGDRVRVTLRRRSACNVLVEVVAPVGMAVCQAGAPVPLMEQDGDAQRYNAKLVVGECLQVGDATVWIGARNRPDKHRDRLRIGIDAPATTPVYREEVYQRLCRGESMRHGERH